MHIESLIKTRIRLSHNETTMPGSAKDSARTANCESRGLETLESGCNPVATVRRCASLTHPWETTWCASCMWRSRGAARRTLLIERRRIASVMKQAKSPRRDCLPPGNRRETVARLVRAASPASARRASESDAAAGKLAGRQAARREGDVPAPLYCFTGPRYLSSQSSASRTSPLKSLGT